MNKITPQQRSDLAKKIEAHFRREWGSEFTDDDIVRIYDYCMDEAKTTDVSTEAMQYETKYV